MATASEVAAYAFPQLSDVELQIVIHIFLLLPADQQLRAAEVSRAWRATVALPALWRRLDLSPDSGVAQPASAALLRAAVARAGSALKILDVTETDIDINDLNASLRAAAALEELHTTCLSEVPDVTALLAAVPHLRELRIQVHCDSANAVGLLERRPPLSPVRLSALYLVEGQDVDDRQCVLSSSHTSACVAAVSLSSPRGRATATGRDSTTQRAPPRLRAHRQGAVLWHQGRRLRGRPALHQRRRAGVAPGQRGQRQDAGHTKCCSKRGRSNAARAYPGLHGVRKHIRPLGRTNRQGAHASGGLGVPARTQRRRRRRSRTRRLPRRRRARRRRAGWRQGGGEGGSRLARWTPQQPPSPARTQRRRTRRSQTRRLVRRR